MHQQPEVSRSVLCSTQSGISSSRSAKPPLCPGSKAPQSHRGEQTPNQKGVSLLGFAVPITRLGRDFPDEQESTQHSTTIPVPPFSTLLLSAPSRPLALLPAHQPSSLLFRRRAWHPPGLTCTAAPDSPPFLIALIPRWKSSKLMTPSPLGSRYLVRSFTCKDESSVTRKPSEHHPHPHMSS